MEINISLFEFYLAMAICSTSGLILGALGQYWSMVIELRKAYAEATECSPKAVVLKPILGKHSLTLTMSIDKK